MNVRVLAAALLAGALVSERPRAAPAAPVRPGQLAVGIVAFLSGPAVVGYISSADCLAVAPVAEGRKVPTVPFDCGTHRIFEDTRYRYVFRTAARAGLDGAAAARYVLQTTPGVKTEDWIESIRIN